MRFSRRGMLLVPAAKLQVATGDYNAMIDKRIADIWRTCGM